MSVVFISPKSRQKMFLMGITIVFLLFLAVVSFAVFLAQPKKVSQVLVFNKPKVNIDMSVFESEQFKNLQAFTEMETQYSYKFIAGDKKTETGFISAVSEEQARIILTEMGIAPIEIKEVKIGRENPFLPYYQQAINTAE
ncbi:MAG: hypothetical protein A2358_04350 [Candidatus Staskawiczbacteria bacterium RIFOXYB1_FULL_37_44]|uniref:Uncharacterized protein n=1 Tax=Candidatus Staskawiczbacteria bacterium RIFOXYB1_FULL_37_44 TaxID=1802223 RepID=A0A1G2IYR0_9BACT|nr:MAG: hypothetical protein A2358_04350 [Candidatus Staskawiczbacteria bacterium RIFOXYB1_FULL_37_44]OGZ88083.1 MAG: hypothetical protein A2444_00360 [Candidatus Staskawiczbacteria bacterium RIFOXYC2_FULL_37_19]